MSVDGFQRAYSCQRCSNKTKDPSGLCHHHRSDGPGVMTARRGPIITAAPPTPLSLIRSASKPGDLLQSPLGCQWTRSQCSMLTRRPSGLCSFHESAATPEELSSSTSRVARDHPELLSGAGLAAAESPQRVRPFLRSLGLLRPQR